MSTLYPQPAEESTIASLYISSSKTLHNYYKFLSANKDNLEFSPYYESFKELFAPYSEWGMKVGAWHVRGDSLDKRLQEDMEMRDRVKGFLREIGEALGEGELVL
jgi:hypothetical protein